MNLSSLFKGGGKKTKTGYGELPDFIEIGQRMLSTSLWDVSVDFPERSLEHYFKILIFSSLILFFSLKNNWLINLILFLMYQLCQLIKLSVNSTLIKNSKFTVIIMYLSSLPYNSSGDQIVFQQKLSPRSLKS